MHRPPVRTITLGIAENHPLPFASVKAAANILKQAKERLNAAGYEVQTLRLSTRPIFDDLSDWSTSQILNYVQSLQQLLTELEMGYCALGPARAADPAFPLARIESIAELLSTTTSLCLTVQLADDIHGIREEAAPLIARVMRQLAQSTPEGFGNFNFAMLACVKAGTPFFPAAYHTGSASLALGLQGVGLVREVAKSAAGSTPLSLAEISRLFQEILETQAGAVVVLGEKLAQTNQLRFGGIDLSPAPMGSESIVQAIEAFGYGEIGSPGTLALASALTRALKQARLPTCGYNGLMLPVLEDALLGQRWSEGKVSIHELLLYSSVCGTGLDTIPLPAESDEASIARILLDVATLAWRLNKPISARLFPVPGKHAGEYTTFTSPYLTNTLLR